MSKFVVTDRGVLGVCVNSPFGWRFLPWVQHSPSRKAWPSASASLPRWAKGAQIIDAQDASQATKLYAAQKDISLAGKVCALSYRFEFDSPEARILSEASEKLYK